MPSSEDCINAANEIKRYALEALIQYGHQPFSAREILNRMSYDEQVKWAEKIMGPVYRGPYSPY